MVQRIEHKFDDNGVELKFCGHKDHQMFVPLTEFGKGKTWDGLRSTCKKCIKADCDNVSEEEKQKRKKRSRDYYHAQKKDTANVTEEDKPDNTEHDKAENTEEDKADTEQDIPESVNADNETSTTNVSTMKERKEHRIENGIELKHCISCEHKSNDPWRTLDCFNNDERRWDKLANWCRECFNERRNATRPSRAKAKPKKLEHKTLQTGSSHRKEHKFIDGDEVKWCSCCSGWKALNLFGGNKSKWDDLETYCKMCYNTKQSVSRNANQISD